MKDWKKELLEKWADIEHKRWSRWQEYMHSKLVNVYEDKNILGLPVEDFKHWERQIATDYKDLSEAEKESDREQVYPYIKDIEELLDKQKKEIIEEITKSLFVSSIEKARSMSGPRRKLKFLGLRPWEWSFIKTKFSLPFTDILRSSHSFILFSVIGLVTLISPFSMWGNIPAFL